MKRLTNLEHILGSIPIPLKARKAAFERFRVTGVLPDDQRLAAKVIERARTGYDCVYDGTQIDWAASVEVAMTTPKRQADPYLDELYNEAVFAPGMIGWAARHVLEVFATIGKDVTEPLFVGWDLDLPDFGGVGLHMLGFPDRLVQRPYVRQARRLLKRAADLRSRLPERGHLWGEGLRDAIEDWHQYGELPDDALLRESVLVAGEMAALMDHAIGKDVSAVMAAYDRMARMVTDELTKATPA